MMTNEPLQWTDLNPEEEQVLGRLSETAKDAIEKSYRRTSPFASCRLIWASLLTEGQRRSLGDNVESAWRERSTLGIWMHVKGYSNRFAALTDLATRFGELTPNEVDLLVRETSLGSGSAPNTDLPNWDRSCGKLYFRDEVVRRVRMSRTPTNLQQILDAFQNAGWSTSIANPLALGQKQLHDTIRQLNVGLDGIRFHGTKGGGAITWSLDSDSV